MLRNPELRRALLLGGLVTLLASAAAALLSGWRAACVTLALGVVLLGLYSVELCRRYRAMARLAADIDAVLHGSGDIHLADYGEGEVSLLRSEVRKMTLRLREQSAQLEKEKLQLADAMADISHQMRTPLTAVNLLLTSLAGHVDEESRGDVRALRRQVARMDWLVESLLKLAKLDAGTARFCPETIPLSALLARAAEPFAIGMELRGQQLQVEASGNVRCDPAWTAEALGNILKNCSEHMQEGTITVRAEENAVASVVVIRDTGGGIAPQDLPHLFERYYKGENAPEQSVGIGLALSRSIAAAQNGTLTAAKEEAEGTVGSGREIVSIAASKHSNALIVTAPQDIMQSLQSVIEQLDIRRAQVHVEALIVEVAEGSNINFGVQWASKDAGLMQFANGTQIPIGTLGAAISQAKPQKGSTVISENGATTINPDTNGDLSTLAQLLSGFSGTAVGVVKGDWMALVQAVKNDSSSNVLSTPSITTLDNQEAFFMVGQDVPVLTGSTVGSNNSNPFNTVERKKVGIMLKVTPQINEGNAVQMVIEQEVSKVEGQTSLDVVFGERKLKTTVLANDGELIVLGGLMDDQAGESVAKVPLLGDIPLIGNLFKSTADKKEKRNLMVFIRPTILRDGMAADGVSQRKYNYMRAEQIYRDEQGLSLMPHTVQPVLPAQNQALPPEVRAFLNAGRTR